MTELPAGALFSKGLCLLFRGVDDFFIPTSFTYILSHITSSISLTLAFEFSSCVCCIARLTDFQLNQFREWAGQPLVPSPCAVLAERTWKDIREVLTIWTLFFPLSFFVDSILSLLEVGNH